MKAALVQPSSSLFLSPNAYIYKLQPFNTGSLIAAISSENSLRVFDPETQTLQLVAAGGDNYGALQNVHDGVTCLEAFGADQPHCVLTAGRDGAARGWDLRSGEMTFEVKDRKKFTG